MAHDLSRTARAGRRGHWKVDRHVSPAPERTPSYALADPEETTLGRTFAELGAAAPGTSGFDLLVDSLDAMAARAALARAAERTLDLQYYLYETGEVGDLVTWLLLEAADRGVRVRLLVDDMDMGGRDAVAAAVDAHPNVEIRLFNRFAHRGLLRPLDFVLAPRVTRRMHNKSFIADGAAAILGGRNIGDAYFRAPGESVFADADILSVGPAVRAVSAAFDTYWNSRWATPIAEIAGRAVRAEDAEAVRERLGAHVDALARTPWAEAVRASDLATRAARGELHLDWGPARVGYDDPEKMGRPLGAPETHLGPRLRPLLTEATSEIFVVSPYFVPLREGADLLTDAVRRGVRVRVLTNSLAATDVWAVHGGYARYRADLVRRGVELYELRPDAFRGLTGLSADERVSLHAKTVVVDARRVFVGSFNFDPRSALYNTEIGVAVESPELARELLEHAETATRPEDSYRIRLENGHVRWEGVRDGQRVLLEREPDASLWRRVGAWIARVLPIARQL